MTDDIDRIIAEAPPHIDVAVENDADDWEVYAPCLDFYEAALDPDTGWGACRKELARLRDERIGDRMAVDGMAQFLDEAEARVAELEKELEQIRHKEICERERAEKAEAKRDELRAAVDMANDTTAYWRERVGELEAERDEWQRNWEALDHSFNMLGKELVKAEADARQKNAKADYWRDCAKKFMAERDELRHALEQDEVTESMIAAGTKAAWDEHQKVVHDRTVEAIYLAMERARKAEREKPKDQD